MPVQFRLKELIAIKERKQGEKITYRTINSATGINMNTLTAMSNNKMDMVGLSTIDRLCDFFECEIGDLLIRVKDLSHERQSPHGRSQGKNS